MTALVQQVKKKQERLRRLLDEAWKLESELNALHQAMNVPSAQNPVRRLTPRPGQRPMVQVSDVDRRVRVAVLTGPLSDKHAYVRPTALLDHCKDIEGVTPAVMAHVLDGLVAAQLVVKVSHMYRRSGA